MLKTEFAREMPLIQKEIWLDKKGYVVSGTPASAVQILEDVLIDMHKTVNVQRAIEDLHEQTLANVITEHFGHGVTAKDLWAVKLSSYEHLCEQADSKKMVVEIELPYDAIPLMQMRFGREVLYVSAVPPKKWSYDAVVVKKVK